MRVEFDIVSVTGRHYFNIFDVDVEVMISLMNGHYIITVNSNGVVSATCDGVIVNPSSNDPIESLSRLSFFVVGVGNSLSFKNLEVYSI